MDERPRLALRHSIAPRVLDNTLPMRTLTSTARFSVRVEPPRLDHTPPAPGSPILATFVWKDPGARVQLAGSFDDWRKHDMTFVPGVGYFVLVVELPPGDYYYRFVVDGAWKVADGDCNLREDPFGEMSHFLVINEDALKQTTPNRFSTAALSRFDLPRGSAGAPVDSMDNELDEKEDKDSVNPATRKNGSEDSSSSHSAKGEPDFTAQMEPVRIPRQRGEEYVNDYDDDACGEFDLQADVYEAMYDVKDVLTPAQSQKLILPSASEIRKKEAQRNRRRKNPAQSLIRSVFARLFGKESPTDTESVSSGAAKPPPPASPYSGVGLAPPEILRQVEEVEKPKKRLRVWFPTERNFPALRGRGRKVGPQESEHVLDVSGTALRFNLAEENASNRQQLGKALFAQGKYDAALALFSLSVKIREDNGLRNAKTTAVAHTDVASAFIHLGDLRNAEKHLKMALGIFDRQAFSGGVAELADVHQFLAVTAEMKGALIDAERSYRKCISLYEKSGTADANPNYETARQNLTDNLRRQREGKGALSWPEPPSYGAEQDESASPTTPMHHAMSDKENEGSFHNVMPQHLVVKPSFKGNLDKSRPGGPTPQTLSTIHSFPGTESISLHNNPGGLESPSSSGNSRAQNCELLDPSAMASARVCSPSSAKLPPDLEEYREAQTRETSETPDDTPSEFEKSSRSSRPTTWKELADVARTSMPTTPLVEENDGDNDDDDNYDDASDTGLGNYEQMSRGWHKDGRQLLIEGKFSEAIDMYTLAIYTRKRHGPWVSKANAETHVEYARCLFATDDVKGASEALRDAIAILENMDDRDLDMMLGQVWGNLGCALDRLGGHMLDAETAHCAGMAAYGRAGLSKDDPRWTKAWRNLCISVRAQGGKAKPIEKIWASIEMQIRGVSPMTKAGTVKIHM